MGKNTGLNFTYGIAYAEEMINQIEIFLNTGAQDFHLLINDISIYFNDFKYTNFNCEEINHYELTFLKNNDKVAYLELESDYKIECNFLNAVLYEIKILKPNELN